MEISKEYTRARRVREEGYISSGDHTLPDYQGDVKKILYSHAEAEEGARFESGDSVVCAGVVVYKIVYLDSEGRLTPVSFTSDYEMTLKCDGERYVDSNTHTRVTGFNLRLMGPRKFSAKSTLECELILEERAEHTILGDGADIPLEISEERADIETVEFKKSEERELAEPLGLLDGAIEDEVDVLLHSAEPRGVSIFAGESGVSVRCQLVVRALVKVGDEQPVSLERAIDYSGDIDMSDIPDGVEINPRVTVISETVTKNPEEGGVSLVSSVILTSGVEFYENTPLRLVKDCFSTLRATEVKEGEFIYTEHIGSALVSEKYSGSVPALDAGAAAPRNILYESVRIKTEETEASGRCATVGGKLLVSAIACEIDEDGAPGYVPLKFELPFCINVNIGCQIPDNSRINLDLRFDSAHIDVDGDNLILSGNIAGYCSVSCERRRCCACEVNIIEEEEAASAPVISVYYPTVGESLYDVAKRFRVSPIDIAKANELSESVFASRYDSSSLGGIDYLIIK